MSKKPESLNDRAWTALFSKYHILEQIDIYGQFIISAKQIKEFREPRLMAKFDHRINLPEPFFENNLAILPITRGDYVISHFKAYHQFENVKSSITRVSLPSHLQSLDSNNITSEAMALNCALASGIIAEFLEDEDLLPTVSGRMGSGAFAFNITNSKVNAPSCVQVSNSQIEIDAEYEGSHSLALFEAKRDLSEDFLIRQLYFPYRVWKNRITKVVRPIFLVYSNGIYHLYEYMFQDLNNYNSLLLVKQKNYSVEDTTISMLDIQDVLNNITLVKEPKIPFPQADNFERVINLCELLKEQELSRNDVTEQFAFDQRQTNYYTDAARYLGLLEKRRDNLVPIYSLNSKGETILRLNYRQRQLALCRLILSHGVFANILSTTLECGFMPSKSDIIQQMKMAGLHNVGKESTFMRRACTIRAWINWILDLVNG